MKKRWSAVAAVSVALILVFAGCRLEDDPLFEEEQETVQQEETGDEENEYEEIKAADFTLDERLYGVWEWSLGSMVERITLSPPGGSAATLTYGSNVFSDTVKESFAGTIVYAANFSSSAGIIIIQYLPGREQKWVDWTTADPSQNYFPLRPDNPAGKNFYGIYFLNLNEEGTRVFLACTNDQNNNYGPTETATLQEAKAKFTQGNMNQLLDLSVGDPQDKVQDL